MAVVNRDLDLTQERKTYPYTTPFLLGASAVITLGIADSAQQLLRIVSSAFSVSNVPILGIQLQRYTPTGITTISLNSSSLLSVQSFATVGMQTHALPSGPSLVNLCSGDHIQVITSGNNAAGVYMLVAVVRNLQDISSNFGI